MFKKFKAFESPHSYVFTDPDTGFKYSERTKEELVKHIITYRHQNRLPEIEMLNAVLDNYWCGLPENAGKCQANATLQRGLIPTIRGGIALLTNLMYQVFAEQSVADTRSEQCSTCPFNYFPDKGPFVAWSDNIAINTIGEKKSKMHKQLGNCKVCDCPLRSKVFYGKTLDAFPEEQVLKFKTVKCWQLELSGQAEEIVNE